MTCREKLEIEHPELVSDGYTGGCARCPDDYGYAVTPGYCGDIYIHTIDQGCKECWDREVEECEEK